MIVGSYSPQLSSCPPHLPQLPLPLTLVKSSVRMPILFPPHSPTAFNICRGGGDNLLPTTRWPTRPRFKLCATSTTTSTSPTTAPRPSMPTMPRPARRWTMWPCLRRRRLRFGSTPLPCWDARNKCEGRACQLYQFRKCSLVADKRLRSGLKAQQAHSPGQSEAAPWVLSSVLSFRPARAKA